MPGGGGGSGGAGPSSQQQDEQLPQLRAARLPRRLLAGLASAYNPSQQAAVAACLEPYAGSDRPFSLIQGGCEGTWVPGRRSHCRAQHRLGTNHWQTRVRRQTIGRPPRHWQDGRNHRHRLGAPRAARGRRRRGRGDPARPPAAMASIGSIGRADASEQRLPKTVKVKNKQPADRQITAEQILREAKEIQLEDDFKAPKTIITGGVGVGGWAGLKLGARHWRRYDGAVRVAAFALVDGGWQPRPGRFRRGGWNAAAKNGCGCVGSGCERGADSGRRAPAKQALPPPPPQKTPRSWPSTGCASARSLRTSYGGWGGGSPRCGSRWGAREEGGGWALGWRGGGRGRLAYGVGRAGEA